LAVGGERNFGGLFRKGSLDLRIKAVFSSGDEGGERRGSKMMEGREGVPHGVLPGRTAKGWASISCATASTPGPERELAARR